MKALRDELDRMKRLFELKKWHSNTLGSWVYPREQTPRSLKRLLYALNEEYQELCRQKAQELKEEGFSATPVTESPSCENKESPENVTAPSDDLIGENLSEDAAAKELSTSEAGDKDAEEPGEDAEEQGDREEEAEASTAWNNEDAERAEFVEEEVAEEESIFSAGKAEDDLVSAEEDTEDGDVDAAKELLASEAGDSDAEESGDLEEDVTAQDDEGLFLAPGFVSDPFEANTQNDWPKVETNDGQLEPLALYEEKVYASVEGCPGYRVNVVKTEVKHPVMWL